jgi:hypothetical protein
VAEENTTSNKLPTLLEGRVGGKQHYTADVLRDQGSIHQMAKESLIKFKENKEVT